jgi:hypothetical protein
LKITITASPMIWWTDRDRDERDQHQHVPLPPGNAPVARPRDHEHRLGQQRERECDPEQELRAATPVEAKVTERGGRVERHADHGEADLPAVQLLRAEFPG